MNNHQIDKQAMSTYQWFIVAICFILNFNDGIDVLLVSFSSSEIIQQWGLSKTEMGYIFSVGLLGMTIGAFAIAPWADKIGRRKIFLISVGMITIGMFGVGLISHYSSMLFFRFITGLGIGGILPTMAATAAEFSNEKYKDFTVGLVQAGWPIGAIFTGLLCAKFIPIYGWQSAFVTAGFISFGMWLLVYFYIQDSLEFLLQKQSPDALAQVNRLLKRMEKEPMQSLPILENKINKPGLKSLFTPYYKNNTLKLWLGAFFGFLTLYTLMSWIPTIAKDSGMPFTMATYVGIVLNIGAALGSASIGALGSKFGLRKTIFSFMLLAFMFMQIYAFSTLNTVLIFVLIWCIGFFVQGGFNGIWPTLSRIYTSEIRTTGVGYTVGIGRFGAILGPWLFGFLSDWGLSIQTLFLIFSVPLIAMGICIFSLKSETI